MTPSRAANLRAALECARAVVAQLERELAKEEGKP